MKSRRIVIAVVGLAIAAAVAMVYFGRMESVSLVAKGSVPVFATAADSMASPPGKTIAMLAPEQRVPVLRCVDVKHYQVYKVRLPDGNTGYVNIGKYTLLGRTGNPLLAKESESRKFMARRRQKDCCI